MKKCDFAVTGMSCAACSANITKKVSSIDGTEDVNVNLITNSMSLSYDETKTDPQAVISAVESIGYGAYVKGASVSGRTDDDGSGAFKAELARRSKVFGDAEKDLRSRLTASLILLIPLMYFSMGKMMHIPMPGIFESNMLISAFTQLLFAVPVIFINFSYYRSGFKALAKRVPNMDSLVALGSCASLLYGIFAIYKLMLSDMTYAHKLYFESAAMILALVDIGKYLEARSKSKTGDALEKLADLSPKTAVIIKDGKEVTVPAGRLTAGDIVVIRDGQRIPADGEVISGSAQIDQSAVTGESIPVEKQTGDTVISGTVCAGGSLRFRAEKTGADSTLSQIIRLVDEAGSSKAPISSLADKISAVFVPVVMGISLITFIAWLAAGQGMEFALTCAVSVLVISCPCALGLATPVAVSIGTGKAAQNGILIKNAAQLQTLASVDTAVFDKTGTLTKGTPEVNDVIPFQGYDVQGLEVIAASLEHESTHPLAKAVNIYAQHKGTHTVPVGDYTSTAGRGVSGIADGVRISGGSERFISESGYVLTDPQQKLVDGAKSRGQTVLIFAKGDDVCGFITESDTVKPGAKGALALLHKMGIHTVMLSGDNLTTAETVGKMLGIDEVKAGILPDGKEREIRDLQQTGHKVTMIGDGINDAPALARADCGIAMGNGTDIAMDSAGIVLLSNDIYSAVNAIKLSSSVMKNIKENLFWAFFYNCIGIPVAAGALYHLNGLLLSPMIGAAAMSISSVCVVLNALRLRRFRGASVTDTDISQDKKGNDTMKKTMKIDGMMCEHCEATVKKALESIDGVAGAKPDHIKGCAEIELAHDVSDAILRKAVEDAGYVPGDIK